MNESSSSIELMHENKEHEIYKTNFSWDPEDMIFQRHYTNRLYLSIILFLTLIFGHLGLFIYVWLAISYNDNTLIYECKVDENVRILSSLCEGVGGSSNRIIVVISYWLIMFITWFMMVASMNIKNKRIKTLQNKMIKISYISRLLALYCYSSYSSVYDYSLNSVTYYYSEANDTLYYSIIGVSLAISYWLMTYQLIIFIIPSDEPIFFPNNWKRWVFRLIEPLLLSPMIFVTLYYLYLASYNNVEILDVLKPRGPDLVSITLLTYYHIFSCIVEFTLLIPVSLYIRAKIIKNHIDEDILIARMNYKNKYRSRKNYNELLHNVYLHEEFKLNCCC
jgi:hypothetical protein